MAASETHVVIVGGGFAGLGCARALAGKHGVRVTLLDRHNYHQFQPLLYQVATAQLSATDIAYSLRKGFVKDDNVDVKMADVTVVNTATRTVVTADGETYQGDVLVLAGGAQANFFNTPGAQEHAFPLYSLTDAEQLRTRILTLFEDADRDPGRLEQGALNFVIVGAGATGVETAGALADMVHDTHDRRVPRSRGQRGARSTSSTLATSCSTASPRRRTRMRPRCSTSAVCRSSSARVSPRSRPTTSCSRTARPSARAASSGAAG